MTLATVTKPCSVASSTVSDDAGELYARFIALLDGAGELTYVAQNWNEELLVPLGYEPADQDLVFRCLRELVDARLLTKQTVRRASGYHRAKLRRNVLKPRRVTLALT